MQPESGMQNESHVDAFYLFLFKGIAGQNDTRHQVQSTLQQAAHPPQVDSHGYHMLSLWKNPHA